MSEALRRLILPLLLLAVPLWSGSASAHPHVFATMNTDLAFTADGKVAGLAIAWTFDELYAQDALGPFTQQADGTYAPADLEALTRENVEALADYEYFVLARQTGAKLAIGAVDPELARNVFENGQLSLMLFVPLAAPADPRAGPVSFKVFDPEYYVAIDYVEDKPFHVTGVPATGCKVGLSAPATNEELDQTRSFLATKGKDWKPEDGQQFGEMFAQALEVSCTP